MGDRAPSQSQSAPSWSPPTHQPENQLPGAVEQPTATPFRTRPFVLPTPPPVTPPGAPDDIQTKRETKPRSPLIDLTQANFSITPPDPPRIGSGSGHPSAAPPRVQAKCDACETGKKESNEKTTVQTKPSAPSPDFSYLLGSPSPSLQRQPSRSQLQPPSPGNLTMADLMRLAPPAPETEASVVQRQSENAAGEASDEVETKIQQTKGTGQPLTEPIRAPMEQAFGADFSGVRIHTDGESHELNQAVQAKAFTTGQDIYFRDGAYEPGSRGGQELLAHELTHVVQQSRQTQTTRHDSDETRGAKLSKEKISHNEKSHIVQRQPPTTGGGRGASGGDTPTAREGFVLVLGRWDQPLTLPGGQTITIPTEGSQALLRGQAVAVFPEHAPGEVMRLPGAFGREPGSGGTFQELAERGREDRDRHGPSGWRGLPSGVAVQEALEGGLTIQGQQVRSIFINVDGVDLEHGDQTASEYRQIVGALASGGNTEVDIAIRHGAHTSTIRRGTDTVEGDPLPTALRRHLPPSFRVLDPGGGFSTSGTGGDESRTPHRRSTSDASSTDSTITDSDSHGRIHTPHSTQSSETSGDASPRPRPRRRLLQGIRRRGAAAGRVFADGAPALMPLLTFFLEQWIQEHFIDPQNEAAFTQAFEEQQPIIEQAITRLRGEVQTTRAHGDTPYAVVTLHVVYVTGSANLSSDPDEQALDPQFTYFLRLSVEDVNIATSPREEERDAHSDFGSMVLDQIFGRTHTLLTYSYEIPDSGVFARQSLDRLADTLVDMYRYIVRLTEAGEVPDEASGVVREMQNVVTRCATFSSTIFRHFSLYRGQNLATKGVNSPSQMRIFSISR